jgi:hypothetical protein
MFDKLSPNLDSSDKFRFLNSAYRVAFFTHLFSFYTVWVLGIFVVGLDLLRMRLGVSTITGFAIMFIIASISAWIYSRFIEGYFIDSIHERVRNVPHIKNAGEFSNGIQILVVISIFYLMTHESPFPNIIVYKTDITVLLHPGMNLGVFEWLMAAAASILYSAITFIAFSGLVRSLVVLYYNRVLHR